MCSDAKELSHCCAMYSVIGALFQLWVWILITYQPFYIRGLEDVDNCKQSALGAMALFVVIFFVSICYLCFDKTIGRGRYGQLEMSEHSERSSLPPGMTDYEVNMELSGSVGSLSNHGRVPYSDDPPAQYSDEPPSSERDEQPHTTEPFSDEPATAASHAQPPDLLS